MRLYDEIMALKDGLELDASYSTGVKVMQIRCAELAKKYDDDIASLKRELASAREHIDILLNDND